MVPFLKPFEPAVFRSLHANRPFCAPGDPPVLALLCSCSMVLRPRAELQDRWVTEQEGGSGAGGQLSSRDAGQPDLVPVIEQEGRRAAGQQQKGSSMLGPLPDHRAAKTAGLSQLGRSLGGGPLGLGSEQAGHRAAWPPGR